MDIDLSQFSQVFFEESLEGLSAMESELLAIDVADYEHESINTIFRAAHSIKGGSATFGFAQIAEFTHLLETLLDEIREQTRTLTSEHIQLLLASVDILRAMINALMNDTTYSDPALTDLMSKLTEELNSKSAIVQDEQEKSNTTNELSSSDASAANTTSLFPEDKQLWQIDFKAGEDILRCGNDPIYMFTELGELGILEVKVKEIEYPPYHELNPDVCYLQWQLLLLTEVEKTRIEEVFEWVIDECDIHFTSLNSDSEIAKQFLANKNQHPADIHLAQAITQTVQQTQIDAQLQNDKPITSLTKNVTSEEVQQGITHEFDMSSLLAQAFDEQSKNSVKVTESISPQPPASKQSIKLEQTHDEHEVVDKNKPNLVKSALARSGDINSNSIRVNINKVDQLINMVGELVITQAMLGQIGQSEALNEEQLINLRLGLEQLATHTRDLQENVMQIRMLPISFAFNRFPRLVHDISKQLGKKVQLLLKGEETELDKSVMERIVDPLVHLVRNAMDHGIELPKDRIAKGKDETGTIKLHAFHRGGNIMIEISDDGAGLNTDKILAIAKKKHLVLENEMLSREEIHQLIFKPGFSTADSVSDLSGRGVGMDVVKRNITELNGDIELSSVSGKGSKISIRLPLTLAILDGQLVRVGQHIYVMPLMAIHESLQIKKDRINHLGCDLKGHAQDVIHLRDEFIPVIKLYEQFNHTPDAKFIDEGLVMIVDCNNRKVGLLVDELLSQQQVVIKNIEENYAKVPGISGATILGDGSVSFIIDVISLANLAGLTQPKEHAA